MRFNRLNLMEQYILSAGTVTLAKLAEQFGISIFTARKDSQALVERGKVIKIYGGLAVNSGQTLSPLASRVNLNHEAKVWIGRAAVNLVDDNANIFLDSGSTILEMVPYLANKNNVTIISHSQPVLNLVAQHATLNLISLGGMYNRHTASFVGMATIDSIHNINLSMAFLSATGISLESGLMNSTYLEAETKKSVIKRTRNNILLADSSKFNQSALFSFCPLSKLSTVITEKAPAREFQNYFKNGSIQLISKK